MGKNGRGTGSDWGENTLLSFEGAFDSGILAVECDIRATKDGAVIVVHDATLQRTAEAGAGTELIETPIAGLMLDEVQRVHVGGGSSPPLFREVLELTLRRGKGIFVELKDDCCAEELARLLQVRDGAARAVNVISFNMQWLERARSLLPQGTDIGVLFRELPEDWGSLVARLGATNVGVKFECVEPRHLVEAERAGIALWVWNPDGREQVVNAVRLGVAGMGSDDPALSSKIVHEVNHPSG
jgi:glycerophosphoryl diester phosphodiesterase